MTKTGNDNRICALWLLILSSIAFFGISDICRAEPVSSESLIKDAALYDGRKITYRGEVIGDVMLRERSAWINVNDGKNAIGVWLSSDLAGTVSYTGKYKTTGDVVGLTGTFNRVCLQHGGDMDIHADSLEKLSAGARMPEKIGVNKSRLAVILAFVLGATWILNRLRLH